MSNLNTKLFNAGLLFLFVFFVLAFGLWIGYLGGTVFDHFMGTNIRPIYTLGSLVGIGISIAVSQSSKSGPENLQNGLGMVFLGPFISLIVAAPAAVFFSGTCQEFITMIGYDGNIYGLAFFGTFTGAIIKLVTSLPFWVFNKKW